MRWLWPATAQKRGSMPAAAVGRALRQCALSAELAPAGLALPAGTAACKPPSSRPPEGRAVKRSMTGGRRAVKARRTMHEEDRSGHQALQAGRGEGGAARGWPAGHHGGGGERVRPAEGSHRALPRRRIRGGFPAEGEDRGGVRRRTWSSARSRRSPMRRGPAGSATARSSSVPVDDVVRIRTGERGGDDAPGTTGDRT